MFSRYESEVVGFDSNWNDERDVVEKICQTEPMSTKDDSTMANDLKNASTQSNEDSSNIEISHLSSETLEKLGEWLKNITPMVLAELQFIECSTAFDDYNFDSDDDEKDIKINIEQNIRLNKTLNYHNESQVSRQNSENDNKMMPIIDLSWNSIGYMLAIATGYLDHDKWCEHCGQVFIYIKKGNMKTLEPFYETKLTSCATAVCFHPNENNLFATSTISGEISIYNLGHLHDGSNREPLICSDSYLHSGKMVSCLLWLNNEQISKYLTKTVSVTEKLLVSGGTDGKVIFWIVNFHQFSITKTVCYELITTNKKIQTAFDVCCIDFYKIFKTNNSERKDLDDIFVVGCRTGELLVCRTTVAQPIGLTSHNPHVQNLESHNGCILSLKFSPVESHKLLTLGADREIRTYDTSRGMLLRVIFMESEYSSARWVPSNKNLVVLTATKRSDFIETSPVQVFDVENNEKISLSLRDPYEGDAGVCASEFHNKDSNSLTIGDAAGTATVMKIPFDRMDRGGPRSGR